MGSLATKVFHLICVKDYHKDEKYYEDRFVSGFNEAKEFCDSFSGKVDFKGKSVLDIGCGLGSTCIYMALNGAAKTVGIDIVKRYIDFANLKLATAYKNISNIVEFRLPDDKYHEKFDVIISKDSFEHYANPESFIEVMKGYLKPDGRIITRFGPLWKSPNGGHITFMTKVPWAHLLFPESVIMCERRRFRPDDHANSFEQIDGGMNKMTMKRYLNILKKSYLEIEYLKTNVTKSRWSFLFKILGRMPSCQEFFTLNVQSIVHVKA
jgi:cyclopropane fatty-acyl-phospholipid synthase-like methyltransferase